MGEFKGTGFAIKKGTIVYGDQKFNGSFHVKTGYTSVNVQGSCTKKSNNILSGCNGTAIVTQRVMVTPSEAKKIDRSEKKNVFDMLVSQTPFTNAKVHIQACYDRTDTKSRPLVKIMESANSYKTGSNTRCNVTIGEKTFNPSQINLKIEKAKLIL